MTPTPALVALAWLVWLLSALLVVMTHRLRQERTRRQPVAPLLPNPLAMGLPISMHLYGAWAAKGANPGPEWEAARQEVRRVHPDLAAALDRVVDAHTTRANLAARRPSPATGLPEPTTAAPGRFGTTPALEACNRGDHPWRTEEQLGGVQTCPTCGAIRGLA